MDVPSYVKLTGYDTERHDPLPSRWNEADRCKLLEVLGDNRDEIKLLGPGKGTDQDAASIRSDHSIPVAVGIYYFEAEILSKGHEGFIGIGFCKDSVALNRLPGWEPESWGYHGDDGYSFCCQGNGKPYGPQFSTGDIIGCAINFTNGTAFYTKNGVQLGTAFKDLKERGKLYPSVGLRTPNEHVRINFGERPFIFDIDGYIRTQKTKIYDSMQSFSTSKIDTLKLVYSYLLHNGFIDTARDFAREIEDELTLSKYQDTNMINDDSDSKTQWLTKADEIDCRNRQHIYNAIIEGDIDQAIYSTNLHYPDVFTANPNVEFKLRCRKFIEFMRKSAEYFKGYPQQDNGLSNPRISTDKAKGKLTENSTKQNENNKETYDTAENNEGVQELLKQALEYGRQLQDDYRHDNRQEIKSYLEETFSLLAYSDPFNSVVSHLLDVKGRTKIAEDVNGAILESLGKPKVAILESICKRAYAVTQQLADDNAYGSTLINMHEDFFRR